jgi:hypothetical protein
MITPYVKPDVLKGILPHTKWIGINLFGLKHSKLNEKVHRIGIHDGLNIGSETKVFLSMIVVIHINELFW